jgi:hypothetical protein
MLVGVPRAPVGVLLEIRHDSVLPEFDYTQFVIRLPRHEPDARTKAVLDRYRYFLVCRAQALAASGRQAEIEPLFRWYQSLAGSRLAPLPVR